MQPAGRVDVLDRHREDQPPGEPAEPAAEPREQTHPAAADDVVAMVDRLRAAGRDGRAVHGSSAVVTRTSGAVGALQAEASSARFQPGSRSADHRSRRPSGRAGRAGRRRRVGDSPVAAGVLAARRARSPGPRRRAAGRAGSGRRTGRVTRHRDVGHSASRTIDAQTGSRGEPALDGRAVGLLEPTRERARADRPRSGLPSIRTIGRTSIVVPDQEHLVGRDQLGEGHLRPRRSGRPTSSASRRRSCRVVPGRMPGPSGVPSSRPPRTQRTDVCVASVTTAVGRRPGSPRSTPRGARPRWPGRWPAGSSTSRRSASSAGRAG